MLFAVLAFVLPLLPLRAAEDEDDGGPPAVVRLAEQAERMLSWRDYGSALERANLGIGIDPAYIPLWRLRARAHMALGENAEADAALRVPILYNAADTESRLLEVMNTLDWRELSRRDTAERLAGIIREIGDGGFERVLAAFVRLDDFPVYMSRLLAAWREDGGRLDGVRRLLRLYASGRLSEARERLPRTGADPSLLDGIAELMNRQESGDLTGVWALDRGGMRREGEALVLTAPAGESALAWLRLSVDWDNVAARMGVKAGVRAAAYFYLRYQSPASFLRLAVDGAMLTVQERVPGLGLANIFEKPVAELAGGEIGLTLKGQRLDLESGGLNLTPLALPVSPAIASGRVALGLENHSGDGEAEAVFSAVEIIPLAPLWLTVSDLSGTEEEWRDPLSTALLVPAAGNVSTLLLAAANAGLKNYALLPAGSVDLDLPAQSLGRFPAHLAGRIWNGVAFRPGSGMDWGVLGAALEQARNRGLETVVILEGKFAEELSEDIPDWPVDWLLFGSAVSMELMEKLESMARAALIEEADFPGRYKAIVD